MKDEEEHTYMFIYYIYIEYRYEWGNDLKPSSNLKLGIKR